MKTHESIKPNVLQQTYLILKHVMKLSVLLIILIIVCSCSPDFHKQKYTNFGHGKNLKMKAAEFNQTEPVTIENQLVKVDIPEESTATVQNKITKQDTVDENAVEYFIAEEAKVHSKLTYEDTLYLDSLEILPTSSDTIKAIIYSKQLKREARRNLILAGVEIVLGVIAVLTLPYWLPVMIIHFSIALIFLLIASFKFSKSKEVLRQPTKYKVRLRSNPSKPGAIFVLSGISYVLLIAAGLFTFFIFSLAAGAGSLSLLVALILLFVILVPVALIALILILIAAILGRNQTRQENLQKLDPDRKVKFFNAINWTMIVLAFSGIVGTVAHWLSIN